MARYKVLNNERQARELGVFSFVAGIFEGVRAWTLGGESSLGGFAVSISGRTCASGSAKTSLVLSLGSPRGLTRFLT